MTHPRPTSISILAALVLAAALATGCSSRPIKPDPAFDAVRPQPAAPRTASDGSIYTAAYGASLFEDTRARRVGDILTILLTENTSANKQANTTTSKANDVSITNPTLFGNQLPKGSVDFTLDQSLQSDQQFTGEGTSEQSNTLSGTITVTVAEVLVNGNMVIRGEKLLTLNQGDEYVRLSGIVRPQDVGADNTVLSTQVANAQIIYGGKGALAEANANGWLGRFFQSRYWPF
jgi:flagellar L-ring protein precursor FlgH